MNASHAIGVVSADKPLASEIRQRIAETEGCRIAFEARGASEAEASLRRHLVDALAFHVGPGTDGLVQEMTAVATGFPQVPIVALLGSKDARAILDCLRGGCNQVVLVPIEGEDFNLALRRVLRMPLERIAPATTVAFVGSGGGAGNTSLAANVAVECALTSGKRTIITELDLHWGTLCGFFDLRPQYSLVDLFRYEGELDHNVVRQALCPLPSSLSVLPGTRGEESTCAECGNNERAADVFSIVKRMTDLLFLDVPACLCPGKLAATALADEIFVTCRLTVPSLRNTNLLLKALGHAGVDNRRIHLVANSFGLAGDLTMADAEKVLGQPVFATVAHDPSSFNECANLGKPLSLVAPKSRGRRDIAALAKKVLRLTEPSAPEEVAEPTKPDRGWMQRLFSLGGRVVLQGGA